MPSGEFRNKRRTAFAAVALAASALLAPLATWSSSSAAGSTPQTITFGALSDRALNEAALVVSASASSGLAVTFVSLTPTVCSSTGLNGATISPNIEGTCTVQAQQAGDATFAAATSVSRSFTVTKGTQTITFPALPDLPLGHLPFTVSATASTGFAVTFTTTTPTVCTSNGTNGSTITLVAAGTCTIKADQAGNAIFGPAPSVSQSFSVSKAPQAITFGALTDKSTLQSPVVVSASSSSLLAVTFTTTTLAVCTSGGTSGATITLLAAGTCTVQADQAGNETVAPAPSIQRSFSVTKADQTITFGALSDRAARPTPFLVNATASSGLVVTFSTTTPAVCTASGASGTNINLVAAGTCTVQADQPGNAIYKAASPVLQSFTVTKVAQTITFGALTDRAALAAAFSVSATASSGLTVSFVSITPTICTATGPNGASVTPLLPGTCTIEAQQAGDGIFNPATSVDQSFTVTKANQAIMFATPPNVPLGPAVTVAATASSGLTVTFSSTTPAVCTAGGTDGATIDLVAAGTCTIQADQAGDALYKPAPAVAQSFGVGKTDQTIAFASLGAVAVGHAPITVSATASSGLAVTFSTTTPAVCTAGGTNGTTITLVEAGTCTVQADQVGNDVFNPAAAVMQSFAVTKANQTIAFAALANTTLAHSPVTVTATASSHLAVKFTSTSPKVCSTGGTNGRHVTLRKAGVCTIRADQPGNAFFDPAPAVSRSFTVRSVVVTPPKSGYWMLGSDGHVYAFGNAADLGSATGSAVALSARRDGSGYWIVDLAGNVQAFGKAKYRGGRPSLLAGEVVSTMSGSPSGNGYWLFTNFGRVFAYGDAKFYGDMSAVQLNGPVIASVATPTGHGYYMVGSDGGVFSFGDARFHGSMGGAHLNRPIVGLSPTPDNRGYWLVASDGGVFAFDGPFRGSLGGVPLNRPVNGLVAYGNGYLMVASDGGVFAFSNKKFVGSLGDNPPSAPIIGIAAFAS